MRVKVSFYLEADEPDHEMGVKEDTFVAVIDAISGVGGDDVQFEKEVPTE